MQCFSGRTANEFHRKDTLDSRFGGNPSPLSTQMGPALSPTTAQQHNMSLGILPTVIEYQAIKERSTQKAIILASDPRHRDKVVEKQRPPNRI